MYMLDEEEISLTPVKAIPIYVISNVLQLNEWVLPLSTLLKVYVTVALVRTERKVKVKYM